MKKMDKMKKITIITIIGGITFLNIVFYLTTKDILVCIGATIGFIVFLPLCFMGDNVSTHPGDNW